MMIISGLLNLIYTVLSVLLVFELPNMPDSIITILTQITGYCDCAVVSIGNFSQCGVFPLVVCVLGDS